MQCFGGLGCPAVYEGLSEITPQEMTCFIGACPAIYEGLREITPQEMTCVFGACPSVHEARREAEVYLIVGRVIEPVDAGLERRVGKGEVLIEVPRALIDNKGK
jgi:hypothetical protein